MLKDTIASKEVIHNLMLLNKVGFFWNTEYKYFKR